MSALNGAMDTGDRAIFGERREPDRESEAAAWKQLEERLSRAVESGEMTREQADKILRERRAAASPRIR